MRLGTHAERSAPRRLLRRRAAAQRTSDLRARAHACRAALEIRETIDRFNERHATPLRTRVGVHVGPVALGPVSGEYHVIGDVPNTASRIEGLNKLLGTTVLASEPVVRDRGPVPEVGRAFRPRRPARGVAIVEIVGRRSLSIGSRGAVRAIRRGVAVFETGECAQAGSLFQAFGPIIRRMVPPAITSISALESRCRVSQRAPAIRIDPK